MPPPFFSTELPVMVQHINYGGHLGNDAVLSLVHEARIRALASLGYSEQNIEGAGVLMTEAYVRYLSEAYLGESLRFEVGVALSGHCQCTFCFSISASGRKVAEATTRLAFYDGGRRRVTKTPAGFRACVASLAEKPALA